MESVPAWARIGVVRTHGFAPVPRMGSQGYTARGRWFDLRLRLYAPNSLRRIIPAIPTKPVPSNPSVPGSGTVTLELPM